MQKLLRRALYDFCFQALARKESWILRSSDQRALRGDGDKKKKKGNKTKKTEGKKKKDQKKPDPKKKALQPKKKKPDPKKKALQPKKKPDPKKKALQPKNKPDTKKKASPPKKDSETSQSSASNKRPQLVSKEEQVRLKEFLGPFFLQHMCKNSKLRTACLCFCFLICRLIQSLRLVVKSAAYQLVLYWTTLQVGIRNKATKRQIWCTTVGMPADFENKIKLSNFLVPCPCFFCKC